MMLKSLLTAHPENICHRRGKHRRWCVTMTPSIISQSQNLEETYTYTHIHTHIVSFLPRDAMQARSLLSRSVCPSVCPSRSWITSKRIFKIFSPSDSDTILVFQPQRGCRYSDGNLPPPKGGVECKGGMIKWRFFSQISRCISKMVIDRLAHAARQFGSIAFSFHPYNI